MSGALIQLVSKGVQDVYLNSEEGHSFFRMKFTRHTNFSQAPKYIKTISDKDPQITIPVLGDLINGIWCEGNTVASKSTARLQRKKRKMTSLRESVYFYNLIIN